MKIEKLNKKLIIEICTVMLGFLLLSLYVDFTDKPISEDLSISQDKAGGEEQEIGLILNAEGIKDYEYDLIIPPEELTKDEIEKKFEIAKDEIDKSVFGQEKPEEIRENLVCKTSYAKGFVAAEWNFSDYDAITTEGELIEAGISKEGTLENALVTLKCGEEECDYEFSFMIFPRKLSKSEQLLKDIDKEIERRISEVGESFALPKEVDGIALTWKGKKGHMFLKVLVFEIVILVLIVLSMKEKEKQEYKNRISSMKIDYSDIVSKMAILVGAGMTIKESWNRISAVKTEKGRKMHKMDRPAYQEMRITFNEIEDGVSEKIAYQKFGERSGLGEYQRFARALIQNMQKGNRGICEFLEKEASVAFEERKLLAKKLGEEAGTKMLIPLLLMMTIVILIVIAPAMMSFKG